MILEHMKKSSAAGSLELPEHLEVRTSSITDEWSYDSPEELMRVSRMGKCPRQNAMMAMGAGTGKKELQFLFKMYIGDAVELAFVESAKASGVVITDSQKDVTVTLDDGSKISGHPDGIVWPGACWGPITNGERTVQGSLFDTPGYLLECKATAAHTFQKVKRAGHDDTWGYLTQVGLYTDALRKEDYPIAGICFVTVCSSTGEMCEQIIHPDDAFIQEARATALTVSKAIQGAAAGELPDRPEWSQKMEFRPRVKNPDGSTGCYESKSTRCKFCPVLHHCFKGSYLTSRRELRIPA